MREHLSCSCFFLGNSASGNALEHGSGGCFSSIDAQKLEDVCIWNVTRSYETVPLKDCATPGNFLWRRHFIFYLAQALLVAEVINWFFCVYSVWPLACLPLAALTPREHRSRCVGAACVVCSAFRLVVLFHWCVFLPHPHCSISDPYRCPSS